jgi:hypothetical protein
MLLGEWIFTDNPSAQGFCRSSKVLYRGNNQSRQPRLSIAQVSTQVELVDPTVAVMFTRRASTARIKLGFVALSKRVLPGWLQIHVGGDSPATLAISSHIPEY